MLKTRLTLGLALAAMAAAVGGRFQQGARTLRSMGLADPFKFDGGPSARNGGRRAGNRAHQRAALKKRNQARNRRAHR